MAVALTPWMDTLTLGAANVPQQLSVLLDALPEDRKPQCVALKAPRVQFLTIQGDENNVGTQFRMGNGNLSPTRRGVFFYGSQVVPIYSMESNLIRLDHIWIMASADNATINVCFITR